MKSERGSRDARLSSRDGRTIRTTFPMDLGISPKIISSLVRTSKSSATTHAERTAAAKKRFFSVNRG